MVCCHFLMISPNDTKETSMPPLFWLNAEALLNLETWLLCSSLLEKSYPINQKFLSDQWMYHIIELIMCFFCAGYRFQVVSPRAFDDNWSGSGGDWGVCSAVMLSLLCRLCNPLLVVALCRLLVSWCHFAKQLPVWSVETLLFWFCNFSVDWRLSQSNRWQNVNWPWSYH